LSGKVRENEFCKVVGTLYVEKYYCYMHNQCVCDTGDANEAVKDFGFDEASAARKPFFGDVVPTFTASIIVIIVIIIISSCYRPHLRT